MDKAKALDILGFSTDENPDDKEVKKAFKKKAVKLHPDINKDENAEELFKELNAAQDYLLNPPAPPQQQFNIRDVYSSVNDFFRTGSNSSFNDFFRTGPNIQFSVPPIQENIKISFVDAVLGSKQTINVDKKSKCDSCLCSECGGRGRIEKTSIQGNMMLTQACTCSQGRGEGRQSDDE